MLPTPRTPGRYAIALVCLGNICRSPTADVVLQAKVRAAGLDDVVEVASCGTGDWHVGNPMDRRAAATLHAAGYDPTRHRARTFAPEWLERYDVLLAMDHANRADLVAACGAGPRIRMFREFDPSAAPDAEVPDPYYGGDDGFQEVLDMVERTCDALTEQLADAVRGRPS